MELVPVHPDMGVEIRGADPHALLDRGGEAFRRAFLDHRLVLLRGVDLGEDLQVRLTELLGEVSFASPNMKGGRKFSLISNQHTDGKIGDGELLFHADLMFMPAPLRAIALYAMVVPSSGGETVFSDGTAAYARLPAALKKRIEGLQARHVANYGAFDGASRPRYDPQARKSFAAIHPLVWPHPQTGRPILFACRLLTESIIGLPADEGEALLQELFTYVEDPAHHFVHAWRAGDYLVWDNCALQHSRRPFDPAEPRAMRRVPIAA
ncbi:MAG: TauD/TfdA dioxygenase family protein [Gammaproteobacteria bacterium]